MTNVNTFTNIDIDRTAAAIKEIYDYVRDFDYMDKAVALHVRLTRYFRNKIRQGESYELLSLAVNKAITLDHYLDAEAIRAYVEYQEDLQGLES